MVTSSLRSVAENLSAHYLQQSYFQHMTQPLLNKTISIEISPGDLQFLCWIAKDKVHIRPANELDNSDLTIRGSWSQLANFLTTNDASNLELRGDLALFSALNKISQRIHLDDLMPHPLASFPLLDSVLSNGVELIHKTISGVKQNVSAMGKEYLKEESELLAHPYLAEHTAKAIDDLRLASERLSARVELLISRQN